jgi:uncharacterized protein (TIGR02246 family)
MSREDKLLKSSVGYEGGDRPVTGGPRSPPLLTRGTGRNIVRRRLLPVRRRCRREPGSPSRCLEASMYPRMRVLPFLVLAMSLAACARGTVAGTSAGTVDIQADERAIRDVTRQWVDAIAARNVDRIVGLYGPDAVFLAPNSPQAMGADAIRTAWSTLLQLPNLSLTFTPTMIRVSPDGTMAYDVGTYSLAFDGPQGRVQDEGKYLVVWQKVNGQWRAAADMFNTNMPMSR